MNIYEGMFLFNSAEAANIWSELPEFVLGVIEKAGGKILDSRRWDERRLCYEIKKQKRATYFLVHFEAPGEIIEEMNSQFRLAERILRYIILLDEDGVPEPVPEVEPEKEVPTEPSADELAEEPAVEQEEENVLSVSKTDEIEPSEESGGTKII